MRPEPPRFAARTAALAGVVASVLLAAGPSIAWASSAASATSVSKTAGASPAGSAGSIASSSAREIASASKTGTWSAVISILAPSLRTSTTTAKAFVTSLPKVGENRLMSISVTGPASVQTLNGQQIALVPDDVYSKEPNGTCVSQDGQILLAYQDGHWWLYGTSQMAAVTVVKCAAAPSESLVTRFENKSIAWQVVFYLVTLLASAFVIKAVVTFITWLIRASRRDVNQPDRGLRGQPPGPSRPRPARA